MHEDKHEDSSPSFPQVVRLWLMRRKLMRKNREAITHSMLMLAWLKHKMEVTPDEEVKKKYALKIEQMKTSNQVNVESLHFYENCRLRDLW